MGLFCIYATRKLLGKTCNQIVKSRFLSSTHNFSSPPTTRCVLDKSIKLPEPSNFFIILTPKSVNSTLVKCPSDLIALSFFLWCARQPGYFHDKFAFHHMVNVVNRLTKRFVTVKDMIRELESVGVVKKPQTLLILLRIYWCCGMDSYGLVFEAFDEMNESGYTPNTFARNIVMDVMFKIGHANVALDFFKETCVPNFLSFSIVVFNLCKINDMVNVRDMLRIMLIKGYYLTADLVSVILNCYCKLGMLHEALQLFSLMITMGIPISANIRSILVDGFCRSGRLVTASSLLEKMVKVGFPLDVVTCTSLVKGFMETGNHSMAFGLIKKLKHEGILPDLVLCNVLIDCLSKMGRYDDALAVYRNLPERKLRPDSYTYSSMISTITLSRKFSLLPSVVAGQKIQADLAVFNSLINYFCKAGCPSRALELYNVMLDGDFVPDKYTYAGLLIGLCVGKSTDDAVNVYRGIIRSNFFVDAHIHTVIMNELIKSGNVNRGINLFKAVIVDDYPLDVVPYTIAIRALFRIGSYEEARRLYEQMKEDGIVRNAHTYSALLCGFCKARDFIMVKQILEEMVDTKNVLDQNTYRTITRFTIRSEHFPSILCLANELLD